MTPMRAVVRITQSPLNAKRWSLDLNCGHEVWVTARRRPTRKFAPCESCRKSEGKPIGQWAEQGLPRNHPAREDR